MAYCVAMLLPFLCGLVVWPVMNYLCGPGVAFTEHAYCMSFVGINSFVFLSGPSMPIKLWQHEIVPFDKDVVIIGGAYYQSGWVYQSSLHRLTCHNQDCEWKTMSQQLKVARYRFVAILIPDELVDCSGK